VRTKAKRDHLPDGFTDRLLACFQPQTDSD
jgi:hypothetical protein